MSTNVFPEPTWDEPLQAVPDCSSFEIAGPSPLRLTGAFIRLLQYHFSSCDNIQNPQLCDLIWTIAEGCSDEAVTDPVTNLPTGEVIPGSNISVQPFYKKGSLSIQQRPAIFIKRESVSVKAANQIVQNQTTPHLSKPGNNFEGTQHQVYIKGKHTFICLAHSGTAAEAIAEEVFFRMLQYMTVIRNDLNLGSFSVDGMSEAKEYADDPKKSFYVSVTVSWAYTYRWRLIQESPILKRFSIIPVKR